MKGIRTVKKIAVTGALFWFDINRKLKLLVSRGHEAIHNDTRGLFNMVIGPFGTKPQVVGVFLFCLEHPKVQVVYSFPVNYTRSYLQRKPGPTLLLPLAPVMRS